MARVQWSHFNAHSVYAWSYLDINLILDLAFFLWKKNWKMRDRRSFKQLFEIGERLFEIGEWIWN